MLMDPSFQSEPADGANPFKPKLPPGAKIVEAHINGELRSDGTFAPVEVDPATTVERAGDVQLGSPLRSTDGIYVRTKLTGQPGTPFRVRALCHVDNGVVLPVQALSSEPLSVADAGAYAERQNSRLASLPLAVRLSRKLQWENHLHPQDSATYIAGKETPRPAGPVSAPDQADSSTQQPSAFKRVAMAALNEV